MQEGARTIGRKVYDQDHPDDEEHEEASGVQNVSYAYDGTEGQPGAQDGAQEDRMRPHHHRSHHGEEQPRQNARLSGRTEPVAGARGGRPPQPWTCPRGLASTEAGPHAPSGSTSVAPPGSAAAGGCPSSHVFISDARLQEMLARGDFPPPEFARPEVVEILMEGMQQGS